MKNERWPDLSLDGWQDQRTFFRGGFDVAFTRFSGRPAPPREGPAFMREAYSHEVISHGFWPGVLARASFTL